MVLHKNGLYYYQAACNYWYTHPDGLSKNLFQDISKTSAELLSHTEESLITLKADERFFNQHEDIKNQLITHLETIKHSILNLLEMKHVEENFIKNSHIDIEDRHAFYDKILAIKVALDQKSHLFLSLEQEDIIRSELENNAHHDDHLKENLKSWFQ
jgi:hypothetical protein